jgi:hypothetical protein
VQPIIQSVSLTPGDIPREGELIRQCLRLSKTRNDMTRVISQLRDRDIIRFDEIDSAIYATIYRNTSGVYVSSMEYIFDRTTRPVQPFRATRRLLVRRISDDYDWYNINDTMISPWRLQSQTIPTPLKIAQSQVTIIHVQFLFFLYVHSLVFILFVNMYAWP